MSKKERAKKLNWLDINKVKPVAGQRCLTQMQHGIIEGNYDKEYDVFSGYYWRNIEWYAYKWLPIEEVQ